MTREGPDKGFLFFFAKFAWAVMKGGTTHG